MSGAANNIIKHLLAGCGSTLAAMSWNAHDKKSPWVVGDNGGFHLFISLTVVSTRLDLSG